MCVWFVSRWLYSLENTAITLIWTVSRCYLTFSTFLFLTFFICKIKQKRLITYKIKTDKIQVLSTLQASCQIPAHPQISVNSFWLISDLTQLDLQLKATAGGRGKLSHRQQVGWADRGGWLMVCSFCLWQLFGLLTLWKNSEEKIAGNTRLLVANIASVICAGIKMKKCWNENKKNRWYHILVGRLCRSFWEFLNLDYLGSRGGRQLGGVLLAGLFFRCFRSDRPRLSWAQIFTHLLDINSPEWLLRNIACAIINFTERNLPIR